MGRVSFRGKYQEFIFELGKFEMPIRHSTGNVKQRGGYVNLNFIEKVWPGGRTLETMRLTEIPRV